jgi:aldehyde:ferredoxin oxidoreductase
MRGTGSMVKQKLYAYAGKILRIDLTTREIVIEPTEKYARKWIGAKGINWWILYNELRPWATPYEPANIIAIGAGPMNGTLVPGSSRLELDSKNTFSGGVGASNVGGQFAAELKYAGFDHIILHGKSRIPIYLWICDSNVELRDARDLWGRTVWETDDLIKESCGDEDICTLAIGPAGENLVRGACVIANRNRAAAKCGLGAIFGSKNLKALAVRGTGAVEIAQPVRFIEALNVIRDKLLNDEFMRYIGPYGLYGVLPFKNKTSCTQYKGWQHNQMPQESFEKIRPDIIHAKYKKRDMSCTACIEGMSQFWEINEGPFAGFKSEAIQLHHIVELGSKLCIDYAPAIIRADGLLSELGLDLTHAAGTIAWAFECFQHRILTEQDTDGLKLEWGDYGVVMELMRKMAYREGFGKILAEGSRYAADVIGRGSDYYSVHMKGQELYEELRTPLGWALGAAVSTRAGGHTTGAPCCEQIPETEAGRQIWGEQYHVNDIYEGKPRLVQYFEEQMAILNALGICMYTGGQWLGSTLASLKDLAELYSAATGWETSEEDFKKSGERMLNVEKAFNTLHAGLSRKDDYPVDRLFREPLVDGPSKGFLLDREKWGRMLDEYYELHDWDKETGLQTRRCLEDLDLDKVADDLEKAGRLK